jgi:hypothetical protein
VKAGAGAEKSAQYLSATITPKVSHNVRNLNASVIVDRDTVSRTI